jgi:hypothetical protein
VLVVRDLVLVANDGVEVLNAASLSTIAPDMNPLNVLVATSGVVEAWFAINDTTLNVPLPPESEFICDCRLVSVDCSGDIAEVIADARVELLTNSYWSKKIDLNAPAVIQL